MHTILVFSISIVLTFYHNLNVHLSQKRQHYFLLGGALHKSQRIHRNTSLLSHLTKFCHPFSARNQLFRALNEEIVIPRESTHHLTQ